MSALNRLTDRLRELGSKNIGNMWQCPAHNDRTPSLSVRQGDRGVILHCHAGCSVQDIIDALGLSWEQLFDDSKPKSIETWEPSSKHQISSVIEQPIPPHEYLLHPSDFESDKLPTAIVERLIYERSTHLLTGASKVGKSFLALQLAMAIASGERFLGLKTTRSPVLYLSLEMPAALIRERMNRIHLDVGIEMPSIGETFNLSAPTNAWVPPAINLCSDRGANVLADLIEITSSKVAFLDTLYRFIPGLDPNSNQDMGPVFGRLNEISAATGCGILPLDHVAKGLQTGPVSASALGAQIKGALPT